jgi:hypothetical protein
LDLLPSSRPSDSLQRNGSRILSSKDSILRWITDDGLDLSFFLNKTTKILLGIFDIKERERERGFTILTGILCEIGAWSKRSGGQ